MYEATIIFSLFLISFRSHRSVSTNIHLHSVMYSPIPEMRTGTRTCYITVCKHLYSSTPCRYENRICYITMHCYMFSNHVHNYLMKWNFIIIAAVTKNGVIKQVNKERIVSIHKLKCKK